MKSKKYKGFTLYEAIIAIGLISLCSVTILQIFIFSNEINSKAKNIDLSNNIVTNHIEEIRSLHNQEDLDNLEKYFANSNLQNIDNGFLIYEYYDNNFEKLEYVIDGQGHSIIPENTSFILTLNYNYSDYQGQYVIKSFSDSGEIVNSPYEGTILTFNAIMQEYDYNDKEAGKELANLSTSHYFVN